MSMIACEFRRTIFSEKRDVRAFMPGASIAEIVDSFDDKPREFETYGAVILYDPASHGVDANGLPNGQWIEREHWHRLKPKAGMALFASVVPQGGGGGGGGKSTFAIIAAIALIALTAWVGGGGLAFLAPSFLGAGTIGAHIAAAAIGIAGATALSLLTRPPAGQLPQGSSAGTTLGAAGISQNTIGKYQQLPAVLGTFRVSPPFLALPFTTLENSEQIVHGIIGIPGRYDISDIRVDTTPVGDLPSGVFEYETRAGASDDTGLTLVTECGFEESPRSELSKHRLDTDQQTLLAPATSSYPKEQIIRTARRANRFRITLQFPSGIANYNNEDKVLIAFRLRLRRVGDSTWVNLPEAHIELSLRNGLRQEIWLWFGTDENDVVNEITGQSSFWPRFYFKNGEWTADSYFDGGDPSAVSSNAAHSHQGQSGIYFFLDTDTFPLDQYDIGITKSYGDAAGSNFTSTSYIGGLFTYRTITDPNFKIPDQSKVLSSTILENYTTFRDEYPIRRAGMAMIAFKAHNLTINSISAVFASYAGTGAPTKNPADLLAFVLTGNLNGRPLAQARLESLTAFATHCTDNGLTCNALVTQGSVEQTAAMVALTGEALLRRSDKWGVVVDKDRSAEDIVALFSPHNLTAPLNVKKTFLAGAAVGLLPSFHDKDQDYSVSDFGNPVFDDGVEKTSPVLIEGVNYDGLTNSTLAKRRALRDLRAARMRSLQYSFGVHLNQLNIKKGSLVGLSHDVLVDTYATGRVAGFTRSGGNLIDLTLNTDMLDLPPKSWGDNFFAFTNVWRVGNVWTGDGPSLSAQVELIDGTVITAPIDSIDNRKITISGTVPVSTALKKTCLVAVGPAKRITRRVILADISPEDDFHATVTCVDEAPDIYKNLPVAA